MEKALNLLTSTFAIIFLLWGQASAQGLFAPGYIISLDQDTVPGFIEDLNWRVNPQQIRFKESENAEVAQFSPYEIVGFGIWGEVEDHYHGVNMEIDFSPVGSSSLSFNQERELKQTLVFLRIQILGPISLYEMRDASQKDHYFIQKEKREMEELVYHRYLAQEGVQSAVVKVNSRFKAQLFMLMGDCEWIRLSPPPQIEYKLSDIKNLIREYNQCIAPRRAVYVAKQEKPTVNWGVMAGLSFSSVTFGSSFSNALQDIERSSPPGYLAGLSLDIHFPRNLKKNSLRLEGVFHQRTFQAQWAPTDSTAFSVRNIQMNFLFQNRGLSVQRGIVKKLNPFWALGLSFSSNLGLNGEIPDRQSIGLNYALRAVRGGLGWLIHAGVFYENVYLGVRFNSYLNLDIRPPKPRDQALQFYVAYAFP